VEEVIRSTVVRGRVQVVMKREEWGKDDDVKGDNVRPSLLLTTQSNISKLLAKHKGPYCDIGRSHTNQPPALPTTSSLFLLISFPGSNQLLPHFE